MRPCVLALPRPTIQPGERTFERISPQKAFDEYNRGDRIKSPNGINERSASQHSLPTSPSQCPGPAAARASKRLRSAGAGSEMRQLRFDLLFKLIGRPSAGSNHQYVTRNSEKRKREEKKKTASTALFDPQLSAREVPEDNVTEIPKIGTKRSKGSNRHIFPSPRLVVCVLVLVLSFRHARFLRSKRN